MVFKRSALLLLAAAAAVVSTNALSIDVESNLKNPIVKKVQQRDGKVILTLQEGKGYAAPKKHHKKKHHQVKKPVVHHEKQVSETREKNEVVKKYPHGKVQIATKESKPVKKHHKKQVTVPPKPEDEEDEDEEEGSAEDEELEVGEDEEGEMKSFGLPVGDSVDVTVDGETVTLKHFKNGSVVMYAGADVMVLNGADIYLDFDVEDEMEAGSASGSGHGHAEAGAVVAPAPKDTSLVSKIEADVSSVAKKFSELATKLTGNGFKEATPIIMIGGAIGALAAVIGIAAVAVGRARANTAAADPQSVLSDATEDVEADIEAGETEEKKEEDEASDESQALDSSDSESESEVEQEEGKFTNEVASV